MRDIRIFAKFMSTGIFIVEKMKSIFLVATAGIYAWHPAIALAQSIKDEPIKIVGGIDENDISLTNLEPAFSRALSQGAILNHPISPKLNWTKRYGYVGYIDLKVQNGPSYQKNSSSSTPALTLYMQNPGSSTIVKTNSGTFIFYPLVTPPNGPLTYINVTGDGSSLTNDGLTMELTEKNGTKHIFSALEGHSTRVLNTSATRYNDFRLTRSIYPDGSILYFHYKKSPEVKFSTTYGSTYSRLQSITSNDGYMVKFVYDIDPEHITSPNQTVIFMDRFLDVKSVVYVNMSESACLESANNCSGTSILGKYDFSKVITNSQKKYFRTTLVDGNNESTTLDWEDAYTYVEKRGGPSGPEFRFVLTQNEWDTDTPGQYRSLSFERNGQTYSYVKSRGDAVLNRPMPTFGISSKEYASSNISVSYSSKVKKYRLFWFNSQIESVEDELGRKTSYFYNDKFQLSEIVLPEGNRNRYEYDSRGNLKKVVSVAKPGSSLPDAKEEYGYPVACFNLKTCNLPDYYSDNNLNTTNYTYHAESGNPLTITLPSVNGIRMQKRFEYQQRYAWIKSPSGSTYAQVADPIWLKMRERYCVSSSTVNGSCASGPGDEVVIDYDYGPDTGLVGNNLRLRGEAVTSNGQTLRTCYGYDSSGRKISETKPAANLTSCP